MLECDIMKNKNYAFVHIETNSDKKIAETILRKLGYILHTVDVGVDQF